MVDIANAFILMLVVGAAWLGVSAVVHKRCSGRRTERSGNHAA